ncbi:inorganic phosphate transport PHO88 [Pluteus cervinus]|uniref:Inorganic phosphate transport PHO88 n=1 Tax=Pluteus cervinus TaxID=181527 RepID=A0ACD3A6P3_9AGAR|nr:inorganic phosphate transport PHO88 [Pluteus cervinus]
MSAFSNIAISLGAMQLAKKIPFEDPQILLFLRIGYVLAQLVILYAYYHVSNVIKQKNDQTVLKYVEQPAPFSQEEPKLVVTTVRDYDLLETSKLLRGAYMGIGTMAIFHIYLHYNQPLFIQTLMGLKNLYSAKPVSIHLLGKAAEGELKRPFQSPGMFGAAGNLQTDAAAIAEAEKRVGSKKDD